MISLKLRIGGAKILFSGIGHHNGCSHQGNVLQEHGERWQVFSGMRDMHQYYDDEQKKRQQVSRESYFDIYDKGDRCQYQPQTGNINPDYAARNGNNRRHNFCMYKMGDPEKAHDNGVDDNRNSGGNDSFHMVLDL